MALIGLVGLATDLGYAFAERRTMQNSADSGALAGAHTLSKSSTTAPLTIINSVQDAAWANKIGSVHPSITSCKYVNDNDVVLADCSQLVPATATGVSVTVQETHHTFFVGVIPGGPNTITTSATAIAHVQQLATPPGDGPFLVCGVDTKTVSGPKTNILIQQPANSGIWKLNPDAVTTSTHPGPTFQIFGPQIALCGLSNNSYKGQAVGTRQQKPHGSRLVLLRQWHRGWPGLSERQRCERVHARKNHQLRGLSSGCGESSVTKRRKQHDDGSNDPALLYHVREIVPTAK